MAALQLPHALRRRGCGSIQYVAERNARFPVLLVHGYAATESVWTPLRRALAEAGFGHIVSLTYNSFAADPEAVSAELTDQALRALAATDAPRIHLVGHSLGGLIVRVRARWERGAQLTDRKRGDDREPALRRLPGPYRPRAMRTDHASGPPLVPTGGQRTAPDPLAGLLFRRRPRRLPCVRAAR